MSARLEHANLSVRHADPLITFLRTAVPEFRVRRDSTEADGTRWVHIGTDTSYIALSQNAHTVSGRGSTLNHLGIEVDDIASVAARLQTAGFTASSAADDHPHRKRVYFEDPDGNEWEFVQYLSVDPAKRNDYGTLER